MALAAADACKELAGVDPGLKWPNDLVVDDMKLAGVLAEVVRRYPEGRLGRGGRSRPQRRWPDRIPGLPNRPQVAPGGPPAATSLVRLSEMQVGRPRTELLDERSRPPRATAD